MKRRTFLAGVLAAPLALKAADVLAHAQARYMAQPAHVVADSDWIQGQITEVGPLHEVVRNWSEGKGGPVYSEYRYFRTHTTRFGDGSARIATLRRNGKIVFDQTGELKADVGPFCTTIAGYSDGRIVIEDDDLTETSGAIPVYEARLARKAHT